MITESLARLAYSQDHGREITQLGVVGGKHLRFSDYELSMAKKRPKREKFLTLTEVVVAWHALIDQIEPNYPQSE